MNKSEILFLYDIENNNPNGDPNDENKPRIDEETRRNIVTDVRLKRTIRDYLFDMGHEIFVRETTYDDEGHIKDAKMRAGDFLSGDEKEIEKLSLEMKRQRISKDILSKCIDIRLFGATIPLEFEVKGKKTETSSLTYTGPVQFRMGRSLHAVDMKHIKGTGAFASQKGATRKTFREEYILSYSLIAFYGIVNGNAGISTALKPEDITLLKKAVWNGAKNLISRSKVGQMPRLMLVINYNCKDFFIGDLNNMVSLDTGLLDEQIRSPKDYAVDLTMVLDMIEKYKNKIDSVEFIADERIRFVRETGNGVRDDQDPIRERAKEPFVFKNDGIFKDISGEVL